MKRRMHCRLQALIDTHNARVADGAPGTRLTQRKIAEEVGVALTTVNRLCQDSASRIDFETVERICSFFNCDVADLLVLRPEQP